MINNVGVAVLGLGSATAFGIDGEPRGVDYYEEEGLLCLSKLL